MAEEKKTQQKHVQRSNHLKIKSCSRTPEPETHHQRQFTQRKHLVEKNRFYALVVSALDSGSKDRVQLSGELKSIFFSPMM